MDPVKDVALKEELYLKFGAMMTSFNNYLRTFIHSLSRELKANAKSCEQLRKAFTARIVDDILAPTKE